MKTESHESRLLAVAEVCKTHGLSHDLILMILAFIEPIGMARVMFARPGQAQWLSEEHLAQSEWKRDD